MSLKRNIVSAVVSLAAAVSVGAQEAPRVEARFLSDSVMIGDRFRLRVEVDKDVMQVIHFPEFDNGQLADSIEILVEGAVDTVSVDGRRIRIAREYQLTCFDAGRYRMGRFPVLYADKNLIDTLWSGDSLRLDVHTFDIDTLTQTIYDVKAPEGVPLRWGEFSGYVLWMLVAALIAASVGYYYMVRRKREMSGSEEDGVPDEPPHVAAIRRLEKLHAQKLWQSGKEKQYYIQITDILRSYLEERFGINAMEMTSQEILERMRRLGPGEESVRRLSDILITADFVKFAKFRPDAGQNEHVYTEAYYFVEDTKQSEREEPSGPEEPKTEEEVRP